MDPRENARLVKRSGLDVGFLCAGWPPDIGGVESHAQDLARALCSRGHRIHVLCLEVDPSLEPFSIRTTMVEGIEVRRLAYAYGDHDRLAAVVVNPRAEEAILAWLAETPCDVVHVHHLTGFGMGALRAASEVGVPLLMTLHDYWPLCPRGQMLSAQGDICRRPETDACTRCLSATWPHLMPSGTGLSTGANGEALSSDGEAVDSRTRFALEMLRLPERLFSPSAAARAVYLRAGVPEDDIEVCENGVELTDLAREVERLRMNASAPKSEGLRLGVLGTVLPSKGVLELARVFAEAQIEGLDLEIHGNMPSYHGDDSYVKELEELSEKCSELHVHGPYAREELPGILAALDGVAAPSRWEEVFGLSVREARAVGLPVLVSSAGALPGVAEGLEGDAADSDTWVVPREDWSAWKTALSEFVERSGQREQRAAGGRAPRSTNAMMLQLEKAYVEVILESTGSMPELRHPLQGSEPAVAGPEPGWFGRILLALGIRSS